MTRSTRLALELKTRAAALGVELEEKWIQGPGAWDRHGEVCVWSQQGKVLGCNGVHSAVATDDANADETMQALKVRLRLAMLDDLSHGLLDCKDENCDSCS